MPENALWFFDFAECGGMSYELWIMDYGLWIMGYGLWVMGYGLWMLDVRQ